MNYSHVLDEEDIKDPSLEDEIKVKYPEHVRIVYSEEDDEGPDVSQVEDGSETEEVLLSIKT